MMSSIDGSSFFASAMIPLQVAKSGLEEFFFANGKMPVVIGVAVIIAIGMAIYISMLRKQLKSIEAEIESAKK